MARKRHSDKRRGFPSLNNTDTIRLLERANRRRGNARGRLFIPAETAHGIGSCSPNDGSDQDSPESGDDCDSCDCDNGHGSPPSKPVPDERLIHLIGPINGDSVAQLAYQLYLCEDSGEPITVMITSPGGSLECGLAIYDHLRAIRQPIVTVVFGCAHSIATIILQAGDYRLIAPNATIQVHNAFAELEGDFDFVRLGELAKEMLDVQRRLEKILSKTTGQPRSVVREWCQKQRKFTARQAIKAGLVDRLNRRPSRRRTKPD
jgi:ATP-dependent Clp protease protease subunit